MSTKLQPNQLLQQQIKGRFIPTELHSRSEIALTFNAVDQQTQLPVTLKYYQGHEQRELQDSLQRGVMLHAQLRSQQVVPVIDFGIHSAHGGVWCVQQRQEHPNLTRFVRSRTQVDSHLTSQILLSICEALQVLHQDEKIHGNLKPNNIFIRSSSGQQQALISDILGPDLSKVHKNQDGRFTFNDPMFFTYEQASGKAMNIQSDIGMIGLIGYFMLTGETPFSGRTTDKILTAVIIGSGRQKIQQDNVKGDARQVTQLSRIIIECLSKQPSSRPKSLESLADALKATLNLGAPLSAQVTPPPQSQSSLNQTLARGALHTQSMPSAFGPPTLTPAHGLFNPLMGGQTMGFDAITDEMLSQLQGGDQRASTTEETASAPVSTPPQVMIPDPPQELLDQMSQGPQTLLGTIDVNMVYGGAGEGEIGLTPSSDAHSNLTPHRITTPAHSQTFMGSPQVTSDYDESTRPLNQRELSALAQQIDKLEEQTHDVTGDVTSLSAEGWGDMSGWSGFQEAQAPTHEPASPQSLQVESAPQALFEDEEPTDSSGLIPSLEHDLSDEESTHLNLQVDLSELQRISLIEGLQIPEEESTLLTTLDPEIASQLGILREGEPTEDLNLDMLFEQAAQDLMRDESLTQRASESLGEFNDLLSGETNLSEETARLDPSILEAVAAQMLSEEESNMINIDDRPLRGLSASIDDIDPSAALHSLEFALHDPIQPPTSHPLPSDHFNEGFGDELQSAMSPQHLEIGGAGAKAQQHVYNTVEPRSIDHLIEHTQLEHQQLEESFPDIPAWRSLTELKDQPAQLYQALLSIPLPLSGQLLPFSQFQLEVAGREEGFFIPAPAAPLPHIPVASDLIIPGEFSNEVSGMWSDADEAPSDEVEPIEEVRVGKAPKVVKKNSSSLINLLIFLVAMSVIGGVAMSMNGIEPSGLLELFGVETTNHSVTQTPSPSGAPQVDSASATQDRSASASSTAATSLDEATPEALNLDKLAQESAQAPTESPIRRAPRPQLPRKDQAQRGKAKRRQAKRESATKSKARKAKAKKKRRAQVKRASKPKSKSKSKRSRNQPKSVIKDVF